MTGKPRSRVLAALLLMTGPALAAPVLDPGEAARETGSVVLPRASYALPTAGWTGTALPARVVEGRVERRAWRLDRPGVATLELLAPLRDQIAAQGFRTLFECETRACGGFDFRFATEVLPEPDMHVDLGDFRFLSAVRGAEAIGLLVSRSAAAGFVQLTHVDPVDDPAPGRPADAAPDLVTRLVFEGTVALDELAFEAGSADLADGSYASLAALADWLAGNAARRIVLVGHTDAIGELDGNIELSRRRAEAVMDAMLKTYGAAAAQISAEGVGFLAPRASNRSEDGRARNRRVEAVVLSME